MRTRKRFMLSRFPKDWHILFVEPFSSTAPNNVFPKRDGNVTYVSTPVLKPHTESGIYNRLIERSFFRGLLGPVIVCWVRLAMALNGFRSDVNVLISNVYFVPVAENLKSSLVCYDCNDDPKEFPGVMPWSLDYFNRLCRRADVVVSCSQSLGERVGPSCGKRAVVIGNGVDYDLFSAPVAGERVPNDIASIARPIVGYTGAIKEWFDFSLVETAARANPQASFVMIGPLAPGVRGEASEISRGLKNVHFLGEKPYESLPLYLAAMQVCLIPFKTNALTSVLNPNKLYEYFAAGKTVVSLKYSEDLVKYQGLMYLVDEPGEFGPAVSRALMNPIEPARLKQTAAANSWKSKAGEMVKLFERGRKQTGV